MQQTPIPGQTFGEHATAWNSNDTELYATRQKSIGEYSNNIETAIAAIGSTQTTLIIDRPLDTLTGNLTIPTTLLIVWYKGFVLDLGGFTLTFNGVLNAGRYQLWNNGTISGGQLSPIPVLEWFGADGDNSTDNAAALLSAFSYANSVEGFIPIPYGVYKITSSLSGLSFVSRVVGDGWHKTAYSATPTGSVINTSEAFVFTAPSTTQRGFSLKDFAIEYTGSGDVITITDNIYSELSGLSIDCNSTGARGLVFQDASYFAILKNVQVSAFTDVGVLLDTGGTKSVVQNCSIVSGTGADANSGLEIRNEGTSVYDGQINVENVAGDGVGILWNNVTGATKSGGYVNGTLSETDTGIKVTGTTHGFSDLVFENTRHTLGGGNIGVIFDRASYCKLINPIAVSPTGGTVVEFTANAISCGLIGSYNACRSGITVDASATDCYSICTDKITYAARANITTNSNLTVTCEDVQYVGKTIHNGTAWDKDSQSVADDVAINIIPPDTIGQMELRTTSGGEEYALVSYNVATGVATELLLGSSVEVNATDGTLAGTTGTDVKITIRCSSTGVIYIENRRGGNRRFVITFK